MTQGQKLTEATLARIRATIPPSDPWEPVRSRRSDRSIRALILVGGLGLLASVVGLIYLGVTR